MKHKFLTQEHLKLLACLLMLIDHIGFLNLVPGYYTELRTIGRLAFPVFCFLLCEGFLHTHNRSKYMLRLAIGAVLSEIPFNLLVSGQVFYIYKQSVMITLLLAFCMAMLMEKTDKTPLKILLIVPFYLLADLLNTDYGGAGVLMVAIFLLTEKLPLKLLWQTGLLLLSQFFVSSWKLTFFGISFPIQVFAVFAMVPIALYSGKKTTHSRTLQWAFYLFYPVHMAILWFLR